MKVEYIDKPYFFHEGEIVQYEIDYIKAYPNGNIYYYFVIDGEEVCKFPEFVFSTKDELLKSLKI